MISKNKNIIIKKGNNINKVYFQSSHDMKQVKNKSVQLIFTSPPYYNLKDYKMKLKIRKLKVKIRMKKFLKC